MITPESVVELMNNTIGFFQEYIRQHELTTYIDETDLDNVKEIDMYLVPKAEVDTIQDLFKKAALAHWGIELKQ